MSRWRIQVRQPVVETLPGKISHIESALFERHQNGKYRTLSEIASSTGPRVEIAGNNFINLCSNDYLGLSQHETIKVVSRSYLDKYGTGSTASRLIAGTHSYHIQLEKKLSDWLARDSVLIFNSGFQLNSSLIAAISKKSTNLYYDRRNHNSLVQGALLSEANLFRYHHLDYNHLEDLLSLNSAAAKDNIIVSESVFSMDGDIADIDALTKLARKYNAILIIDEAHAIGMMGDGGRGLCYDNADVDIVIGTFGKAFGSFGAFIACEKPIREYLINFCSGFIYTTALPPAVIGSITASVDLMPELDKKREYVSELGKWLREALLSIGADISGSGSHIIPIVTGSEQSALALSENLKENGFLSLAIRPPTVEPGRSRIRLTLNTSITKEHLSEFIEVVQKAVSSLDDKKT